MKEKFFRWLINLFLAASLLLAAAVWLPKALHMEAYVVKSSSMEPAIRAGSVIYVSPCREGETISQGDIISFCAGGTLVTHRVLSVDPEHNTATTKGDANQVHDPAPVPFDAILGKVRFYIPGIGYLLLR